MAVAAASFTLPARSQPSSPPPSPTASLPAGTELTFVLDDTLSNPKPRPGTTLRVHLREALAVGSLVAAAAGATDRIRISTAVPNAAVAAPQFALTIAPLALGAAGRLPLTVVAPAIPLANLVTGTTIVVKTDATLTASGGKVGVHIPLPFALSNDAPYADWTPIPLRTAPSSQSSARPGRRNGSERRGAPTPAPSSSPLFTPAPSPTGVSR